MQQGEGDAQQKKSSVGYWAHSVSIQRGITTNRSRPQHCTPVWVIQMVWFFLFLLVVCLVRFSPTHIIHHSSLAWPNWRGFHNLGDLQILESCKGSLEIWGTSFLGNWSLPKALRISCNSTWCESLETPACAICYDALIGVSTLLYLTKVLNQGWPSKQECRDDFFQPLNGLNI